MELKTFTVADIRALAPCYDPVTGISNEGERKHPGGFLPEGWAGTVLDILRIDACPAIDRLWVVCHEGWIDNRTLRLFAVWCARQALALIDHPDPRSVSAVDTAERYANGQATDEERAAAWAAAGDAAWDAAGAAAWAAGAAARDAARAAAGAAAWDAAGAAARAAAWAAGAAAWDAARAAAWAAARAARAAGDAGDAAWAAAWDAQIKHLIEMLEAEPVNGESARR
jgi:hypothetical protein